MIPENKFLKLNREFRTENLTHKKPLEKAEENKDSKGKTTILSIDAAQVLEEAKAEEAEAGTEAEALKGASSAQAPETAPKWTNDININDFICQTLENDGIEVSDDLVNKIFVEIVRSIVGENPKITLVLTPSISWVTQLIDALLSIDNNDFAAQSKDETGSTSTVTKLIDLLLAGGEHSDSQSINASSTELVKRFILDVAQTILEDNNNNTNPTNPGSIVDNGGNTNPTNNVGAIDASAYPAALSSLINSMNGLSVDGNMSIKDFLLQLQTEASLYIRQQNPSYSEGFSDIIAMFLAQAVSDTQGTESGLMKDVDAKKIKEKFLEFIQDLSFLDTSTTVWARSKNSGKAGNLEYFSATPANDDGYKIVGRGDDSLYIHGNDDLTYNADGSINNGVFLKYLLDSVNTILGGKLNGAQLSLVMEKIIVEFSGNNLWHDLQTASLYQGRTKNDKNKNNTFFDELYNAIIKVTNSLNISTGDLETADTNAFINSLFGSKSSISASYIHQNENNYLINSDPALREIMSALINASNRYNVTTDVDYLDFLNVFIKQIYEICGEPVKTSGGQPVLTKEILQKYFETHTLQDLKDFVESTKLRNAYYMENVISTGGIDNVIDEFHQHTTGDCYLLAALKSLSESEYGRAFLESMIHINDDGTYTVILNGSFTKPGNYKNWKYNYSNYCEDRHEYKFTLDDLFDFRASYEITKGDWTITLIEAAIHKLMVENAYVEGFVPDEEGDPYLHGGSLRLVMHWLTGDKGNSVKNPSNLEFMNFVLGAITSGEINKDNPIGNYVIYMGIGSHAYAVTKVTNAGITYVDPFNSEVEIFITWDQFLNEVDKNGHKKYDIDYAPIPAPQV